METGKFGGFKVLEDLTKVKLNPDLIPSLKGAKKEMKKVFLIKDGKLPEGAIRIHLYNYKNILKPRGGTMEKESLSLSLHEELIATFEDWTDSKYGDNPERAELLKQLKDNLDSEVQVAWEQFSKDINLV